MRIVKMLLLVLAIALVPLSVGLVMLRNRQNQEQTRDRALLYQANEQSAVRQSFNSEIDSSAQILANNPALSLPFTDPAHWPASRPNIDAVLLGFSVMVNTGLVDDVGLIDVTGWSANKSGGLTAGTSATNLPELAHIREGSSYTTSQLAYIPTRAPEFIEQTLKLRSGEVYSTKPLVSPDTGSWVMIYSALLPPVNGKTRGLVYFEFNIEALRGAMAQMARQSGIKGLKLAIIDSKGYVIMRSDIRQGNGNRLGAPGDKRFVSIADQPAESGLTTIKAHDGSSLRVAWNHLPISPTNANTWTVVAVAPALGGNVIAENPIPVAIAAAALLAIALFMGRRWVLTSNQAMTDVLTSLGNRRKLVADLQKQLPDANESSPLLLALYDLDGFKNYNDSFGHPAGDALLTRLGKNLQTAMRARGGDAYRMGGDEFCVVVQIGEEGQASILADASAALSDRGEGFAVGSSYGAVLLPQEADDVALSLRLADQRLYASKNSGRRSAGRQSADVLLQALHERSPELGDHLVDVARLTGEVGRRLGMSGEELDHLRQAAQLHDVGKMAIPDSILRKPGPLDREEWEFIRGHTVVGERIVSAAPSLAQVSKIVRSSHERFNGSGYPDGLKGEEIPLPSRIIAVCDAYDAMIGPRPYRLGMDREKAATELRRCAGNQFDPVVVDFFLSVVDELEREGDEVAQAPSS